MLILVDAAAAATLKFTIFLKVNNKFDTNFSKNRDLHIKFSGKNFKLQECVYNKHF